MNFLYILLSNTESTSSLFGDSKLFIFVFIALIVVMFVLTIIPQKKRQKQQQQMMDSLKVGTKIKTIGGMIGKIVEVRDADRSLVINVGTDEFPTLIVIDRQAIYNNMDMPMKGTKEASAETDNKSIDDDKVKIDDSQTDKESTEDDSEE